MSETSGELPQSTALDEAKPESLGEITNLDPEKFTDTHIERMVTMLRAAAERRKLSADTPKPTKAPSGTKSPAVAKNPKGLTIDDLGI